MELNRETLQQIKIEAEVKAGFFAERTHFERAYLALADAADTVDVMIAEQELANFATKE